MVIQKYLFVAELFGFVMLFSATFPSTCALALLGCAVELLVDEYELRNVVRRPLPHPTAGIGLWLTVFHVITFMAIPLNGYIVTWIAGVQPRWLLTSLLTQEEAESPWVMLGLFCTTMYVMKELLTCLVRHGFAMPAATGRVDRVLAAARNAREAAGSSGQQCLRRGQEHRSSSGP